MDLHLKLKRKHYGETFTEGKMFINEGFECYTVEDTDRHLEDGGEKVQNKTAIPKGVYDVTISYSNRFKKHLIEVREVEGFSGIRIHSGNSSKDTEGCIIVGASNEKDTDDWVSQSKIAYDKLHKKVKEALFGGFKVTLEVA